jgi:hypothetical protein
MYLCSRGMQSFYKDYWIWLFFIVIWNLTNSCILYIKNGSGQTGKWQQWLSCRMSEKKVSCQKAKYKGTKCFFLASEACINIYIVVGSKSWINMYIVAGLKLGWIFGCYWMECRMKSMGFCTQELLPPSHLYFTTLQVAFFNCEFKSTRNQNIGTT